MNGCVHFTELPCSDNQHKIAKATLGNPSSLNALTFDMLRELKAQLELWQDDDDIVCVILDGEGSKAFCAGGDVRTMHQVMQQNDPKATEQFCCDYFTLEYQCDYLIHTYYKPVIAWGEGIVMGGGVGLYMGSSHKVVTPTSRLAMPEVSIGLFPDVGATWFLNRLEEGVGLFLGMTGAMVNASDALSIHLADHIALPEDKETLIEQLQVADWQYVDDVYEVVSELLEAFHDAAFAAAPPPQLVPYLEPIRQACHQDSVIHVADSIMAIASNDPWLDGAKRNLASGSPITCHLCYRQMTQFQQLSLADCFRLELSMAVRSALLGEFQEGVRSRLIDKDNEPHWKYASIAQVDTNIIDQLVTSYWSSDKHPLALLGHY